MKCNKTFIPEAINLSPKKNATTDDDDDIAYAKYGAKFWDNPTYIVSHSTFGNLPLIFEAPKMELFLKAKKFYDMAAPIFKICDLEHEENQQIFTSFYIYYTQLFEKQYDNSRNSSNSDSEEEDTSTRSKNQMDMDTTSRSCSEREENDDPDNKINT
ncbi:unnamed protein product [Gordionus sp. m RMFG-2023]